MSTLDQLVIDSAARAPDARAVADARRALSYRELDQWANRIARGLHALGVGPGDRVGLWLDKTVEAVATMQAVLRLRAAYVPLDPLSPSMRVEKIVRDCEVKVVVATAARAAQLSTTDVRVLCTDRPEFAELEALSPEPIDRPAASEHDLAYILYTSGSTGMPKGVCISHLNALAFVRWAAQELEATAPDRFANHAPFFFDLSVLDLYCAFLVGGSVQLIPDAMAFAPRKMVELIRRENLTIWYSVPSALILMMEQGGLLESPLPLRAVLFAGEPFPIKQLRQLRRRLTSQRMLNLYGPTETNVCTFYEVKDVPDDAESIPIGRACCGDRVWVEGDGEGELLVSGPTVMIGYWGKPPVGEAPYRTGDLVRQRADGELLYLGRRDHMVKVRGRRMELGEIETALLEHDALREAAVVVAGEGAAARLVAFLVRLPAVEVALLEVKRHCAERLPRYMIVDEVRWLDTLPRTRNGKVDRLALRDLLQPPTAN